ncbi:MAG: barstar family protein [Firmicutes bacterium]|nr:barstar family protein [Bacillota bacterium]
MPITTDPVVLHLDGCKDWGALHRRIRKTFGFPDYYGENWDAMWDCPLRCGKSSVTFRKNIRGSR